MQINKWAAPGPSMTSQVRSLRKVNNDQVAIAIDTEPGSAGGRLEDEDEDKGNCTLLYFFFNSCSLCHINHLTNNSYVQFSPCLSSWFQVTYYIKNCSKIYKTCNRHDRWPMVTCYSVLLFI